jgi:hypothetical protein
MLHVLDDDIVVQTHQLVGLGLAFANGFTK